MHSTPRSHISLRSLSSRLRRGRTRQAAGAADVQRQRRRRRPRRRLIGARNRRPTASRRNLAPRSRPLPAATDPSATAGGAAPIPTAGARPTGHNGAARAAVRPRPTEQQFVYQTLQMWETESAKINTFNADFERLEYDTVWGRGDDDPLIVSHRRALLLQARQRQLQDRRDQPLDQDRSQERGARRPRRLRRAERRGRRALGVRRQGRLRIRPPQQAARRHAHSRRTCAARRSSTARCRSCSAPKPTSSWSGTGFASSNPTQTQIWLEAFPRRQADARELRLRRRHPRPQNDAAHRHPGSPARRPATARLHVQDADDQRQDGIVVRRPVQRSAHAAGLEARRRRRPSSPPASKPPIPPRRAAVQNIRCFLRRVTAGMAAQRRHDSRRRTIGRRYVASLRTVRVTYG